MIRSFRILNEYGYDVSSEYKVILVHGTLTVLKRKITIYAMSAIKYYDGLPLTQDRWAISRGSLIYGHILEVETDGSLTNVGTNINVIKHYRIIDSVTGEDITHFYDVECRSGTLTVLKP